MPVDSHLTWAEIRDFSPGLWTVNDQLMPPSGAQQMLDCFAAPSGGLRAWFKSESFPVGGISSRTNERPRGLFVHEGMQARSGNGLGNDYYLVTFNTVDTKVRFYRMDQTDTGPPTTWTLLKTTVAGLDPGYVVATDYIIADGTRYAVFALGAAADTDNGIWAIKYDDGSMTQLLNGQQAFVANYQSRLIAIGSISNLNPSVIQFTDPGTLANFSTNSAPVDISEGVSITSVAPFSPGDLLVFKGDSSIYLVEGDLDNYTVRQMNGSKNGGNSPVRGPNGVIFQLTNDGVYETPDGSSITPLSKNLSSETFGLRRQLIWQNHWLFSMQNGGMVYDYDTGCWFATSVLTNLVGVGCRLKSINGFLVADEASGAFTLNTLTCIDGADDNRCETYTWKSAPLRDPNGRQIEIRAIEIIVKGSNGTTGTITVTVGGVAQTFEIDSSGRGTLAFYFRARHETLDVTVTAASNAAGVEAPRIEAVRIGSQGGHFLRPIQPKVG